MGKYSTLKNLAGIINFIAWLNLISGIILTIFSIQEELGSTFIISSMAGGLIGFILLLSFGKLILLALDIREKQVKEEVSRETIQAKGKKSQRQVEISETSITDITDLRRLIIKQKQNFIGNKQKKEIISLLNRLITSEENAKLIIDKYENIFGVNIVDELKDLSKNYAVIKEYLLPFIEFKMVKEEYPHELIE